MQYPVPMTVFGDTVLAGVFASSVLLAAFLNFEFVKKPDKTPPKETEEIVLEKQYTVYGDPLTEQFQDMENKRKQQKQLRAEEAEKRELEFERQQREILGESKRIAYEDAKRIELGKEIYRNKPSPNTDKKAPSPSPPRTPPPSPPRTPSPPPPPPPPESSKPEYTEVKVMVMKVIEHIQNNIKSLNTDTKVLIEKLNKILKFENKNLKELEDDVNDWIFQSEDAKYSENGNLKKINNYMYIISFLIKDDRLLKDLNNIDNINKTFQTKFNKSNIDTNKIYIKFKKPKWVDTKYSDEEMENWKKSITKNEGIGNFKYISNFISKSGNNLLIVPKENGELRDMFQYLRDENIPIENKLELFESIVYWSKIHDNNPTIETDGTEVPWLHVRIPANENIKRHFKELESKIETNRVQGGSSPGNYAISVLGVTTLIITAFAASVVKH